MTEILSKTQARELWLRAQRLDTREPFGKGPAATQAAIEHLGYVQIDTINVIERCHHHILFSRIPEYKRKDLQISQAQEKSVFEYWTHALSYVPTKDFRYFIPGMKRTWKSPNQWYQSVKKEELQKVLRLIKKNGPISIRDINDDVLVEKDHEWASRKPSKRALQHAFYSGLLVISERQGMLKKYELADRHFSWETKPKAARESEILQYKLERALRSQGFVSLESICHLDNPSKPGVKRLIDKKVKKGELIPIQIESLEKPQFWMRPEDLNMKPTRSLELVHILSPFDPLIIQRKRLKVVFDYEHIFEAYIPKEKRVYGYFALPVLIGDQVVAVLDLKTEREKKKLLMQKWTWLPKQRSAGRKALIESELDRFESFQLGS